MYDDEVQMSQFKVAYNGCGTLCLWRLCGDGHFGLVAFLKESE